VLDQVQADHEAGRQSRPADALAVERPEGGGGAIPIDQAGQAHQGMPAADEVHQGRAEEFGLLGWRRFEQDRPNILRLRWDWFEGQPDLHPDQLEPRGEYSPV
jgi:hypothetical protein